MKLYFTTLVLAALVSGPAVAYSNYAGGYGSSYHCGPLHYDSSGAPVAVRCR
jgi:hypothetical protein